MNMKSILLASAGVFALSSAAFATDKESYQSSTKIEKDSDGNYSEKYTASKTDSNGTTNSSENKLKIEVDSAGNTTKTRSSERVTDPKGLGNKHVVTMMNSEKTKDGQVTTTHSKTVDGKTTEGTTDHYKTSSKIVEDSKGNYAEKDITTKTENDGTIVSFEKNANVAIDDNGDTDKSTTTKKVTDPKGLMNKSVVKTSNTEKTKDGVVVSTEEMNVDGKTVDSKTTTTPQ